MIYEHFRATGAYEAVQGLSDLFNIRFKISDIRWDQALLRAIQIPPGLDLEGLYKSKFQDSVQLSDCIGSCVNKRIFETTNRQTYSRLTTVVRRHILIRVMRTRNFRVRNATLWKEVAVTKSHKRDKNKRWRGTWENAFSGKQLDSCSKGDSCSFSHDRASGNRCDQRRDGKSSSPAPKVQAAGEKVLHGTRGMIPCRHFVGRKCTNPVMLLLAPSGLSQLQV